MMMLWSVGSLPLVVVGATWSFPVMAIAMFTVGWPAAPAWSSGARCCSAGCPRMLGRVASLDFFVSLSFMPLSMALAGPLSKVVPVQLIFAAAGTYPSCWPRLRSSRPGCRGTKSTTRCAGGGGLRGEHDEVLTAPAWIRDLT